ncbi:MAG TPA: hypothetical protein K8W06_04560 [Limosilactobacillus coleohominis]|nr:hypothetical protein [Limosilactobacillus coleohominis]
MKLSKEQEKCPYCHEPYKEIYTANDVPVSVECNDNGTVESNLIIDYGDLENGDLGGLCGSINIKYCPFCGRKL